VTVDDQLEHVAALLVTERQPTEALPDVAAGALARGIDSPSLRLLAGTSQSDVREARDLFWEALRELGGDVPSPEDARWSLVLGWARDIDAGRLRPIDGARRIWSDGWEELGRPDELTQFVGLASEWEDHEAHRDEYDRDIRRAARRLIERRT